jgi:hypothetical protein
MSDLKREGGEAIFPHEAPNGTTREGLLAVMAAWGDGDPFADTIQAAAPGQAPPGIRARRCGETEVECLERIALWEQRGLKEE